VPSPCRAESKIPIEKGKVESGVGYAQRALQGKRFESLEEAQAYLDRWEASCADTRIHGTTKRQVAAMFAEEKPALLPLPLEPFRYYQHGQRVVHLDGCVEAEAAYYSLPPGWIGRQVNVQWDELFVRILDPKTGQLLREHVRQKRGWYRIKEEDHPKHRPLRVSQLRGEPAALALTSAHSATLSIASSENPAFAASWASSHWRRSSALLRSRTLARRPSKWECTSTALSAAISNVVLN
jgi:hypothetical protein